MGRQALLIVDMQQGLFAVARDEDERLIARINAMASRLRSIGAPVVFLQHRGPEGSHCHPSQPGFALQAELAVEEEDIVIGKASCDVFLDTELTSILKDRDIDEVIVTGCTTDFCIDTTVRSALAHGYRTIVPVDGHTTFNRPYLPAEKIIEHHHAVWSNFLSPVGPALLSRCDALGLTAEPRITRSRPRDT